MMKACVFCSEVGVATTTTTTPSTEALPFLLSQLELSSLASLPSPNSPPAALSRNCHNLWEEVALLYTNMQGLVTLMGRRVGQIQQKLQGSVSTGQKNPDSMFSWWYPSVSMGGEEVEVDVDDQIDVKIKTESLEEVMNDEFNDHHEGIPEVGMEQFEIRQSPEPSDAEEEERSDQEEEDVSDPNYDPLSIQSTSRSRKRQSKSRTNGKDTSDQPQNSTHNTDDMATHPTPSTKRPRFVHDWKKVQDFPTLEEAKDYIAKLGKFVYHKRYGKKLSYHCRRGRATRCPAKAQIEICEGGSAIVYLTLAEHLLHEESEKSTKTSQNKLL